MHELELAAAAAWPAERTEVVAGWLLRHTPAVARRRSNSALPPPADQRPERALDAVEAFYRAAGLPAIVQVSPAEGHAALDVALAARGYRREAPTLVLTATPTAVAAAATAAAMAGRAARDHSAVAAVSPATSAQPADLPRAVGPAIDSAVVIDELAGHRWLAAYQAINGPADTSAVAERVLARIPAPAAFARAVMDGEDAAIGLFVADGSWAGVFCMATARSHRRRGLALAVLDAGARWAAGQGCARLYLQVEQDNIAARDLYARAGFTHSHGYHYRVADSSLI